MNKRTVLITGVAVAGLAVAFGAFGSHALKAVLLENGRSETYETAVRYQMYHALAMLLVGVSMGAADNKNASRAAGFFLVGIILFSGSLYMLCLMPLPGIVFLTPVGGVMFMLGWVLLLLHFLKKP